ncbi:uncharacterized protein KIAA2026-like [Biomphalaria glabrata]|uniref:Uncharacterized protein KIAA2026-like n=1 Tax=Biomphalaria glabrata TaxID=6526 RepID=A0A9U8DXU5_BIOGL|nr:uncharacterized protein KIAA2026-like [Biomphalaria glabrata]XP_013065642.2 uncharacterized protein KIAA2026-like [Biomphalaria glabrata]
MEFQEMDSNVTGSSVVYFSNDTSEPNESRSSNHDANANSVNIDPNDVSRFTQQHLGEGVLEGGFVPDECVDSIVYEEYEVGDTVVSSTDNNEALYSFDADQDSNSSSNAGNQSADHENTAETETLSSKADHEDGKCKEKFNVESLNYELQVGYRILSNMMSASNRCVNKLFLYPVDDNYPETSDYYEKIKEPMWMFKMKEKFENHQYKSLTDFMADFRLMIENCYRFNGPDNFVSKKAQKLETMMKQKIALLSRDLRDKIYEKSCEEDVLAPGNKRRIKNPNMLDDSSQQLLSQLRRDREMQEKSDRRQKVEDRKAMEQAKMQDLQEWEDRMLGPDVKDKIRTMWELPQIGLFVYLCMESLGLEEEVTQYQLERGLALPRECSDFRRLMTCLLSTPHQRKSLKSFMPYHVWNNKLTDKIDYFYKVLAEKKGNSIQACYKLGLDTRAFRMMGKSNPLQKKKFHELSFLKRVWILKNYCDFCMETQQYLQKTIDDVEVVRPNDVREVLLGSDGRGYRYINFPMFTGKDIRIFKHAKTPEPSLESLEMLNWSLEEKPSASSSRCSTPVNQRNSRASETPSTSLRARALLQAAESKEASPFRDSNKSLSDAPDSKNDSSSCDIAESNSINSKLGSTKKRKRTGIFNGKRKRFKAGIKKPTVPDKTTESAAVNGEDCEDVDTSDNHIGDNSFVDNLNKTAELNDIQNQNGILSTQVLPSLNSDEKMLTQEELHENSKSPQSTSNLDDTSDSRDKNSVTSGADSDVWKENKENSKNDENLVNTNVDKKVSPIQGTEIKCELPEESLENKIVNSSLVDTNKGDDKTKLKTAEEAVDINVKAEVKDEHGNDSLDKVKSEDVKKEEEDDAETDEDDLPDVGCIELVAESMEEIRQLMNKLSNPEPVKRGKRTYPGMMKPCEEELLANVTRFYDELLKYEKSLSNARVSMQSKLRKEVESYVEETKGWDSDHSQSSQDSSEEEEVISKPEPDTAVRQSKKLKPKQPSTTALLSSAASKLNSITGEGHEDSNDSYELDISSRGRLRKRRVIPNNTEDTGLKKRKNLTNQESIYSTQAPSVASSLAILSKADTVTAATSIRTISSTQPNLSSSIMSMLRSPQPNSAIKAQLSSPAGQVLRLVSPGTDGIRTIRVSGKPNMIISSQNLSNLRFITSTGVVSLPRNTVTTSTTQASHPVIQQLLLNQAKTVAQTTTKTVNSIPTRPLPAQGVEALFSGPARMSNVLSVPSRPLPAQGVEALFSGPARMSNVLSVPSTVSSKLISPQSGSHTGSKQVLDIGLSVTQIQQLIRNQAIQINTGTGNPATLVLSAGLQSLSSKPNPVSAATINLAASAQLRMPSNVTASSQPTKVAVSGVSSLLSTINKSATPQSQVWLSNKSVPGQGSPQVIRPQFSPVVRVNSSLNTEPGSNSKISMTSALAIVSRTNVTVSSVAGKVVAPTNLQKAVVRQGSVRAVVSVAQKPIPKIISSLNPMTTRMTLASSVSVTQTPLVSSTSQVSTGVSLELTKAKVINVPLLSTAKKYASNVTVKALLENRGPKKLGEEDESGQASDTFGDCTNDSESTYEDQNTCINVSNKIDPVLKKNSFSLANTTAVTTLIPHTHPLSVDTGIPSRNVTSSEVIVPTVNIKVPSPNTLPSVLHNKNGTTIVQSTKVPIPVVSEAKTGDSPINQQNSSVNTVNPLAKVNSGMVISSSLANANSSAIRNVGSALVSQPITSSVNTMKNVMLKVTSQPGGPGQFVQGYMTPRGLVIPQAALLQQQQNSNVISLNVSQPGAITQIQAGGISQIQASNITTVQPGSIPQIQQGTQPTFPMANVNQQSITHQLQQPSSQQILINSPPSSTGMVNNNTNPNLKVMFLNSTVTCSQSSSTTNSIMTSVQPSNTPASELVKQLANNSHIQSNGPQSVAISPGANPQNQPHILSNMIQGTSLQISNSTILPTQTILNAGVSPQLAQIFTLQQGSAMHQQPNIVITTTKPSSVQSKPSVVSLQLQQLGQFLNLGSVSQVQLPQQQLASLQQLGNTSRVGQPNQVLQLAINPQVGGQTIMAAPQGPQIVRVATQLSPQVQSQGLPQMQPQNNIIIQQQQGQNIVVQQQGVIGNASQQLSTLQQASKASTLATTKITTSVGQNSNNLVISQLQSSVSTPTPINQIQYVLNSSPGTQPGVSALNKISVGSLTGTVNRIIRADSGTTLQVLPPQGTVLTNASRQAAALTNKGAVSQMIIPNTAPGQFLISPVKLAPQNQQANLISPIKYIGALQSPSSVSGQSSNQFVISSAMAGLPAQVSVKPSVIYASQANGDKKEGKVAQLLLGQPSNSQQASSAVSVTSGPKLAGGESKTILYKIGDQYFSPASNVSGTNLPQVSTNIIPAMVANAKTDVQLLVPPACIEASDQILKHTTTVTSTNMVPTATPTSNQILVQNRSVRNTEQSTGSVNGIHQGNAQFSFSLSGPTTLSNKSAHRADGLVLVNGQASVSNHNTSKVVSQDAMSKLTSSKAQFPSDQISGPMTQLRPMSNDELTLQEQNEKEAALNLLTLANQNL